MPNPRVRTLVCPTCNTHAPTQDGRFMAHISADGSGSNCPNTGRLVLMTGVPGARGPRTPGSQFESCPAATGEADCTDFPDGAHRCGHNRGHIQASRRVEHSCTCGAIWFSQMGTLDELVDLMNRRPS
jgi:hypothetical protein